MCYSTKTNNFSPTKQGLCYTNYPEISARMLLYIHSRNILLSNDHPSSSLQSQRKMKHKMEKFTSHIYSSWLQVIYSYFFFQISLVSLFRSQEQPFEGIGDAIGDGVMPIRQCHGFRVLRVW